MADNLIDFDGFERYGPSTGTFAAFATGNLFSANNQPSGLVVQGLSQGGWVVFGAGANTHIGLVDGLSGNGTAVAILQVSSAVVRGYLRRNLPSDYNRIIIGFRFMSSLAASNGIKLGDLAGYQVSLFVDSTGRINLTRGDYSGTSLYQSGVLISANTMYYIELDVKIDGSAGLFQIWLNGVSQTSASSQNTKGSTTTNINQIVLGEALPTTAPKVAYDDVYWRDNTGGTATPYGDCIVEGLSPTADSSVAFSATAAAVGSYAHGSISATAVNGLALVPIIPSVNMTINSIGTLPAIANGIGTKFKGVIYSDNSNAPGSLLSSGTEVLGCYEEYPLTLPLVTPQSLVGGTRYWIGMINNASVIFYRSDATTTAQTKANTYGSGAPAGPLSSMTTGIPTYAFWGNCTSPASNYAVVNTTTPQMFQGRLIGYNQSSSISDQDLFTCGTLSNNPQNIFSVKVSTLAARSSAGARTMDLRIKTGSPAANTTGSGNNSSITPSGGGAAAFYSSRFDTDPNTSGTWGATAVNTMKAGYKIVT